MEQEIIDYMGKTNTEVINNDICLRNNDMIDRTVCGPDRKTKRQQQSFEK